MSQYHNLFITETREHLSKLSALVLELESDPEDRTTVDALFRSVHSVKGMAASMGFDTAATLAHKLEDLMDRIRKGLPIDSELFDLLLAGEAALSKIVNDIEKGGSGNLDTEELLQRVVNYGSEAPLEAAPIKPIEFTQPIEPPQLESQPAPFEKEPLQQQSIKIKTSVMDRLLDTTGELITVKHRLMSLAKASHNLDFSDALRSLEKQLRALHDQVMAVRLMPLSVVTERFPRMVRDIARKSGKEVSFSIKGGEIELDRSILDLIGDPLSHLLRNSVDHGIETTDERVASGKNATGRVGISVSREKDQVELRIDDDGRGMTPQKIFEAAIAKGFISRERSSDLTDDEKLLLICHPGFSTSETVTDISGRGVGMDVVKTAIQSMGGTLAIISEAGAGSSFRLRIPLTVAIINVLLVKEGKLTLAIPLTVVERTLALKQDDIATVNDREFLFLADETLPIVKLANIMNLKISTAANETVQFFISELKGERTAVQVDGLLGNQEVFVKPLSRPLSSLHGINGATVLGSGEVVFIIDILNKF
ncbi:MAG: chemotaxis protein CheA [Geobacteraceae bacterium]|nr:chemotaxis protein CheA [Geobacteraceae bacterium]